MTIHYSPLEEGGPISEVENIPVLMPRYERRDYPDCPLSMPMTLFNEEWAIKIHSQSLTRLAQRGGLSPREMWTNIERKDFRESPDTAACIIYLNNLTTNNHEHPKY